MTTGTLEIASGSSGTIYDGTNAGGVTVQVDSGRHPRASGQALTFGYLLIGHGEPRAILPTVPRRP